jgi:hypothetical protein
LKLFIKNLAIVLTLRKESLKLMNSLKLDKASVASVVDPKYSMPSPSSSGKRMCDDESSETNQRRLKSISCWVFLYLIDHLFQNIPMSRRKKSDMPLKTKTISEYMYKLI